MGALIKRLKVERFRGLRSLTFYPEPGLNVILGGGDVGKTTVLEAVGLLLHPTNSFVVTDADYFERRVEEGFVIEAVFSVAGIPEFSKAHRMNWPWAWDGKGPIVPTLDSGNASASELVYVARVTGTPDFELLYELLQPDGAAESFSVGLRRAIGLLRLAGDDRNDRDLRLVQGSALDRLIGDKGLKSRLGHELTETDATKQLGDEAKNNLISLEQPFADRFLPTKLGLGFIAAPGVSLNALIGLTAAKGSASLPLACWGAGTRRLAALTVAGAVEKSTAVMIIDEIERGFEPYRQRALVGWAANSTSQAFITTHSPAVVGASANGASIWFMDFAGRLGQLPSNHISAHLREDPATFLSRLAIICEGVTEVGFLSFFLEAALRPRHFVDLGLHLSSAGGNEKALELLEALASGGVQFGALVDNEGRFPDRWQSIKDKTGDLTLQWREGCTETSVISSIPEERLPELIRDPTDELTGERLRCLAERLHIPNAELSAIQSAAGSRLRQTIIEAATGTVPEHDKDKDRSLKKGYQSKAKLWFKSREGGTELASKVFSLGVWGELKSEILPLLNAILTSLDLPAVTDIQA